MFNFLGSPQGVPANNLTQKNGIKNAINMGDDKLLQRILRKARLAGQEIDINAKMDNGVTPMEYALSKNMFEMAHNLILAGATITPEQDAMLDPWREEEDRESKRVTAEAATEIAEMEKESEELSRMAKAEGNAAWAEMERSGEESSKKHKAEMNDWYAGMEKNAEESRIRSNALTKNIGFGGGTRKASRRSRRRKSTRRKSTRRRKARSRR